MTRNYDERLAQLSSAEIGQTIPRRDHLGPSPLSFAQQRLWFLDQLEPASPFYNIPLAIRMVGILDVAALEATLAALVARHEALRTTFTAVEGSPLQIIAPVSRVDLPVLDLSGLPDGEREARALELSTAEARRPFDLVRGPLLRVRLLRLGATEHLLVLVLHHIVSDGWSMGVIFRELGALYRDATAGRSSSLPELPVQYADFAVWQRALLGGAELAGQLAYWRTHLAGAPSVLELPADRPRPPRPSHRGARHAFVLPTELCDRLKVLSQREGVTLFMTVLAAFQALLGRYTGEDDIVVGSPMAGRTRVELEGLIGFFVNTLVLRTELAGDPPFRELLARVCDVALGAYDNSDVPFERLVEELRPERDLGRMPLVQVIFALQNVPRTALTFPDLVLSSTPLDPGTSRFDLALSLTEGAGGLAGSVQYSTDLFEAATIDRLASHYRTLLEGIVADPQRRLSALPLLSDAERRQLLGTWNATARVYPQDRCFHMLFEEQVSRTPEAVALDCADTSLTYAELNRRANRLAHHLRWLGVGPEVRVGIAMERSIDLVVGMLGVLKAGGAYLPLDPAYPAERLGFMLGDAGARVLLTHSGLVARVPAPGAGVVLMDAEGGEWNTGRCEENPSSGATPANLAYVLYTSGSSGRPKGVMVEHRSLVNYLCWAGGLLAGEAVHALPTTAALTFDASLKQLFAPLVSGGTVWVLSDEAVTHPAAILRALGSRMGVGLNCVPSVWAGLLDALDLDPGLTPGDRLGCLFLGGEELTPGLVRRSLAAFPGLRIWNLYGPTEATANATAGRVAPADRVSIGRPIANTQAYVLDRHLHPVPLGVVGELCLGGDGLGRGYLGRPALTADRFRPNPFSEHPGARLYRTGDRVRQRPDGQLDFLGRLDQQVKLRGFRIELGEIETVLREHPAVREAVVLVRDHRPGDPRLLAYVIPTGSAPAAGELRDFLARQLPAYMLPAAFLFLESLPRTRNGKVDPRALPGPGPADSESDAAFVAPHTLVERTLAAIWETVLGVGHVGVQDEFFQLGGHSLLATQVISRIRTAFGIELPLRALFEAPTVAGLAGLIEAAQQASPGHSAPPLVPRPRGASRP